VKLDGKTVLIIGLKRTGVSVARFIAQRGGRVRITDRQAAEQLTNELAAIADIAAEVRVGAEDMSLLDGIDLVVPSPGVPCTAPLLVAAQQRRIPVWSEIELAFRFLRAPVLAVTGTNGKSTTTTLLGELLREHGQRVFVGGNLGTPLLDAVSEDAAAVIAEVSSFQLEWVEQFRPRIGLWLNLTEDHLDRHETLDAYGAAKRAMFVRQAPTDWMIVNRHDPAVQRFTHGLPGRLFSFGWEPVPDGVWIEGEKKALIVNIAGQETRISLAGLRLYGRHNLENVMAAVAAATLWGVPSEVVERVLARFTGLRHRLELVATKQGVSYFDDSKGTNVGAVVQSLASFTGPVILLAGGVDKGGDYAPLRHLVQNTVKKLILFGAAKDIIADALGSATDTLIVETLAEAVDAAARAAGAGDTVLLSPACASFDQFRNYAHRGEVFRAAVEAL